MLSAIEYAICYHPASLVGRLTRRESELKAFDELESRHLCHRHEYEPERGRPALMVGEMVATVAILGAFVGALTVVARMATDLPPQDPVVASFDAVESH